MSKSQREPQPRRMRATIVVESENAEDLDEGLKHGVQLAREGYISIKISLKGRDEHGPTIAVRTARVRRKSAN